MSVGEAMDDVPGETYTEAERELFQDFSHRPEKKEDVIDFSPYDIDMDGFPFATWRKLSKKVLDDANSELFARGDAQGDLSLRHTISRYLHSSRGVNCSPEQIIVGAGNAASGKDPGRQTDHRHGEPHVPSILPYLQILFLSGDCSED